MKEFTTQQICELFSKDQGARTAIEQALVDYIVDRMDAEHVKILVSWACLDWKLPRKGDAAVVVKI